MKRKGFTLIATLITVAIICILMVIMMQSYTPAIDSVTRSAAATTGGKAQDMNISTVDLACKGNLSQLRQAIQAAKLSSGDENPPDLQSVGIGANFYKCPVGGEAYVYDPATGTVHCPHPGHQNF